MSDDYFSTRRRKDSEVMRELITRFRHAALNIDHQNGMVYFSQHELDKAIGVLEAAQRHLAAAEAMISMGEALAGVKR